MKKKNYGKLTLVPTPIDDVSVLEETTTNLLLQASEDLENNVFVVEEHKEGRRRWLRFGLPREVIAEFKLLNEHTRKEMTEELLQDLSDGKDVYLMSDCGLPAFCDPGQPLVERCHDKSIKVTSTPFHNSVVLALALSGFDSRRFMFEGFLPSKGELRDKAIANALKGKDTFIVMDAPYRLKNLLERFQNNGIGKRQCFLAMDLNQESEELVRGNIKMLRKIKDLKREFILVIGPVR